MLLSRHGVRTLVELSPGGGRGNSSSGNGFDGTFGIGSDLRGR